MSRRGNSARLRHRAGMFPNIPLFHLCQKASVKSLSCGKQQHPSAARQQSDETRASHSETIGDRPEKKTSTVFVTHILLNTRLPPVHAKSKSQRDEDIPAGKSQPAYPNQRVDTTLIARKGPKLSLTTSVNILGIICSWSIYI